MPSTVSDGIVKGRVEPGFEAVAEEFGRNFTERGEVGAAFAAVHSGRTVVDIWGGNAAPSRPWQQDTLQVVFSGTKGLLAGCMLILIERGLVDIDAPVAKYWPEFAQGGKERILVRHIVSHRSGVPGVLAPLSIDDVPDYEKIEGLLATQPIANDPDAFACYNGLTIGWLCGAIVRRVDGRTLGQFFADEIARPLNLEAWIGLPEDLERRVGVIEVECGMASVDADPENPINRSIWQNPPLLTSHTNSWNTKAFHAAQIGGAGCIATARSIARYYGCLSQGGEIDGVRILKSETLDQGLIERSRFTDPYFSEPMAFATAFALQTEKMRFGPARDAFGHSGAGGSIHAAWPSRKTGLSYTMNQMRSDPDDRRSRFVLEKLFQAVNLQ
ncbi:serine hydrolase domain-containing protein [Mesorhizobium sp. LjNodule214]|uniref:serine hydrolase domain-containing protein n=1 Tax=Mesorhizobium sp. LjNodule214 TaxID=3342252 RepID=UPI003ECE165B